MSEQIRIQSALDHADRMYTECDALLNTLRGDPAFAAQWDLFCDVLTQIGLGKAELLARAEEHGIDIGPRSNVLFGTTTLVLGERTHL